MPPKGLPSEVTDWVRGVFRKCNERIATKLSRIPTTHETSLDLTLIEQLSQFSAPFKVTDWVVRIDTHYLGGGSHFGSWEVADVGVLVIFRKGGKLLRTKVGLLQSKRLYPHEGELKEDRPIDYMVGFGRLLETDDQFLAATEPRLFAFTEGSRYEALSIGDEQYKAIADYEEAPHEEPSTGCRAGRRPEGRATLPIHGAIDPDGEMALGCRVVPARALRAAMAGKPDGHHPSLTELRASLPSPFAGATHRHGWRLEHFVADLLMGCKEGHVAQGRDDPGLRRVFTRRSGPISAAIAITIDEPAGP